MLQRHGPVAVELTEYAGAQRRVDLVDQDSLRSLVSLDPEQVPVIAKEMLRVAELAQNERVR